MNCLKRISAFVLSLALLVSMMVSGGVMKASAIAGAGCANNDKSILGIDLSYWNVGGSSLIYSRVDFDKLVASGCKFAILRIGLGSSSNTPSMDKAFLEYYRRARAAGMHLGVYFYSHALTYNEAANEAKWCINIIESNNMYFEYPIFVDMEESDQVALGSTAFTNVALGFCDTMANAGYYAGFYGMHSSQSKLTSSFTSKYDRWTAKVKTAYDTSNQYTSTSQNYRANYTMWQFTWVGTKYFSGVTGNGSNLDVNICYKDYPAIMAQYGYNNVAGSGSVADKLGTYRINSNAPASDPLNVRSGAGTTYDIVTTVQEGNVIKVTELNGNWGKFKAPDGKEGWASMKTAGDYIGVDALAYTNGAAWGEVTTSVNDKGSMTIVNNSTEQVAYDFKLPLSIGTSTTPYFCVQITPVSGSGYYFGLTQDGSGYFMMRDCNSGDQLVNEVTAPYMTGTEKLEINLKDWWTSKDYQINAVRFYVAPSSTITINYMYFAAGSGVVIDETYNLAEKTSGGSVGGGTTTTSENKNLMSPNTLKIVDTTKAGSYNYNNGVLSVTADTDNGFEVSFAPNVEFKPEMLGRWLYHANATVRYDIEIVVSTSEGDRAVSLVSDYWPGICTALDGNYIPAGNSTAGLDLYNMYIYNNVMPADGTSVVKTVTIKAGGKGVVTVDALQIASEDVIVTYPDGITKRDSSAGTPATPSNPVGVVGDVNDDGAMSTADVRVILRYTVGSATLSADQQVLADYDGDGTISTIDARRMLMQLAQAA